MHDDQHGTPGEARGPRSGRDDPRLDALPRPPRYGRADVSVLVPDAVAALTGQPSRALPLPEGVTGVIVLVVDGLGRRQLDEHAELAPFLASCSGTVLDAPFPSTTTTSLTSIGTGLPPGEHGVVGSSIAVPGVDRPLVVLTWSWDREDSGLDARGDVVPEHLQPHATAFDRARAAGIGAVTVLRPEFGDSGLTRAGLRGGELVPAVGLAETLDAAIRAAARPQPTVVYAHHGDLDAIGHLLGLGTDRWCTELAAIDTELARQHEALPDDVALVVTADHGMVATPPEGLVELSEDRQLLDGVRVLAGEARARQLHVVTGAVEDVLAAWRERCGELAHVVTRDEAIDAGWFGPEVADPVRRLIGDVVTCATVPGVAWIHRDADKFGGRLAAMHGALTAEEREVPALVVTRND